MQIAAFEPSGHLVEIINRRNQPIALHLTSTFASKAIAVRAEKVSVAVCGQANFDLRKVKLRHAGRDADIGKALRNAVLKAGRYGPSRSFDSCPLRLSG